MGAIKVLAIDLYGTLLDTSSIIAVLVQYVPADKVLKIAQDWRKYQLEYTWRLNSMSTHRLPHLLFPHFLYINTGTRQVRVLRCRNPPQSHQRPGRKLLPPLCPDD